MSSSSHSSLPECLRIPTDSEDSSPSGKPSCRESRKELRAQIIAKRGAIPAEVRAKKSKELCEVLLAKLQELMETSDTKASLIAVYSAFPEEVQLDHFIRKAYQCGARIAFPCMIKDSWGVEGSIPQTMEMREVLEEDYLNESVEFLLHPLRSYHHSDTTIAGYPYVPANKLDLLICPLVAFDKNNNRLGYGGGNYDRYLTQLKDTSVVGVAFTEQELDEVPVEEHDIPIPIIAR